jgi:hypothetical protein
MRTLDEEHTWFCFCLLHSEVFSSCLWLRRRLSLYIPSLIQISNLFLGVMLDVWVNPEFDLLNGPFILNHELGNWKRCCNRQEMYTSENVRRLNDNGFLRECPFHGQTYDLRR